MKRWYKAAAAVRVAQGWGVTLDGKLLNTPQRTPVVAPTRALAHALAGEWQAQGGTIALDDMRLTRLLATALDRIRPDSGPAIAEIVGYAATDLLCHRAEGPAELRRRQDASWQPILDWVAMRYGAKLAAAEGVMPVVQPPPAVAALRTAVAGLDSMRLAGLHGVVNATGSLVLGLALLEGHIDAERAWEAADLDEAWQREQWGDDPIAAKRRLGLEADLRATARFLELLRG
ncbi:MAG: ATP12 family chaperone protein [Rhodospirillales bacterium]